MNQAFRWRADQRGQRERHFLAATPRDRFSVSRIGAIKDEPAKRENDATAGEQQAPPAVFVSYTHENRDHKTWVRSLAERLRANGIDVILDQWDLPLGRDVTLFMEQGIRRADRTLLICTPAYKRKADEGTGGVGYERLVVTAELARELNTTKFICVLRDGDKESSIPLFAATRRFVDFRDDAAYELSFDDLLRELHNAPANPKPALGLNPFAVQANPPPKQIVTNSVTVETLDAEATYERAELLLRGNDLLGWKRLTRKLRSELPARLLAWRLEVEQTKLQEETWPLQLRQAVEAVSPLIVCALSAVESEIPQVKEQCALIDDLLNLADWNASGHTVLVETPTALAYVYHHLLGAFLIQSRDQLGAIELLSTRVTTRRHRETLPLWKNSEIVGWPDALGGNCTVAWPYLLDSFLKNKWVQHFFAREADFVDCVRAYSLVGSIIELSDFISRGATEKQFEGALHLEVPPMFAINYKKSADLQSVINRALPDLRALELLAQNSKVSVDSIRRLWPLWLESWQRWHTSSGRMFVRFGTLTLP